MTTISMLFLLTGAFATYRISDILVNDRGPFDLAFNIRKLAGVIYDAKNDQEIYPEKFLPLLFSCIGCMSVWVGFFVFAAYWVLPEATFLFLMMPFALSGSSKLIDSHTYKG